ncbi:MAG: hypothetical protein WCP92_09045, partial [bacterium]
VSHVKVGAVLSIVKVIPVEKFPARSYHVSTRIHSPVTVIGVPAYHVPLSLNPEKAKSSVQITDTLLL